jgi:hypothetical protein
MSDVIRRSAWKKQKVLLVVGGVKCTSYTQNANLVAQEIHPHLQLAFPSLLAPSLPILPPKSDLQPLPSDYNIPHYSYGGE